MNIYIIDFKFDHFPYLIDGPLTFGRILSPILIP